MLPRVRLCCLPTPCHRLERLSGDLGVDLWIKRDDLTGFAGGGNKGRKLEYLMADVLDSQAGRVVTCGSRQSNFIRQLGAACSAHGVQCSAVVMALPYDKESGKPRGRFPKEGGNVILDRLLGVDLVEAEDGDWLDLYKLAEDLALRHEAAGENVYRMPIGGSSPLGAYSFVQAAVEVGEGWDAVVTPTSSGSTHAGLAWAYHGTRTKVIGIACDPEADLADDVLRLANALDGLAGYVKKLEARDLDLRREWTGPGYNVGSPEAEAAIELAARREGVFLDPVYTGKAFAGLLALARDGELAGQRVLFWHTGGLPTLLAGS